MPPDPARTFAGCDYLGLAANPSARTAAIEALAHHRLSTTASRTTTGDTDLHRALEADLADFLNTPTVLLPDGYTANIAACEALAAHDAHENTGPSAPLTALIDERAHPSLHVAARAAGLPVRTFRHRDPADLSARRPAGPIAVLTDGVFTADGAIAPARDLLATLGPRDTLLLDDCHALGVIGPAGRGTAAHAGIDDPRILTTSTLAKGLGAGGGFVAGPQHIVDLVRTRATAYVCTTPTPPAMVAAAQANLAHLRAHHTELLDTLARNAAHLRAGLSDLDILTADRTSPPTPIAAFDLGPANHAVNLALVAQGFTLPLMAYPGGPSASYFRASVSAAHATADIDALLETLARCAPTPTPTVTPTPART